MSVVKLHEKQDLRSKVNTLRVAALKHSRQARDTDCAQGIFISRNGRGTMIYDAYGCTDEEKISMLESAKYLVMRELWG